MLLVEPGPVHKAGVAARLLRWCSYLCSSLLLLLPHAAAACTFPPSFLTAALPSFRSLASLQASSLLEQRLLPLLGSIRAQLGPKGDSGSLAQLEQLVASLNQLSGMLQPPPAAQDQQALGLLQWLQSAGAMGLPAGGPAASAPSPAPSPVVRAEPAAAPAGGDSDQVQAMLQRVAGLLKLQKELGTA